MSTVADFLGKKQAKSRYPKYALPLASTLCGIELEVDDPQGREGVVHPTCISPTWKQVHDGSLNNGYEYVLNAPLAGKQLTNAIYQLFDHGTKTTRTFTGSTHIHVNVIDGMRMNQLKNLVLLCYYFEDMLYGVGDYSRKWCGYANPMASIPVATMKDIFALNDLYQFNHAIDRAGRYYGLNLKAMEKFGSVEFRYFPTATSPEELLSWLKLVQLFKKAALESGTPAKLVDVLSTEEGVATFMAKYFSDYKDSWHYAGSFGDIQKRVYKSMIITEAAKLAAPTVRYSKKFDETRYGRLLKTKTKKLAVGELPFRIHLGDSYENRRFYANLYGEDTEVLVINKNSSGMAYAFKYVGSPTLWMISDNQDKVNLVRDNLDAVRAYLCNAQTVDGYDWLGKFDYLWEYGVYKAYLEEREPDEYDEDDSEGEW